MELLRKYGVQTDFYFPLIDAGTNNFAAAADYTHAAGDTKISKDGGAAANVTNVPTVIDMGNAAMWKWTATATEMQAAKIMVVVSDAATKAVEDQMLLVTTHGNDSAEHAFDMDTANVTLAATTHTGAVIPTVTALTGHTAQTGDSFARIGVAGAGLTNINLPNQTMDIVGDITGSLSGSVGSVTTVSDKSGYRLSATGVDDVLDEAYEGTTTLRQFLRLAAAALFGKLSGAATTSVTIRDEADSKDRIAATVDADGNRSAITLDKT